MSDENRVTVDKYPDDPPPTRQSRMKALDTLLSLLKRQDNVQLIRNCCLTLHNFSAENELAFRSREATHTLMIAAIMYREDSTVRTQATRLCCHSLAALDPWHKRKIGQYTGDQVHGALRMQHSIALCLSLVNYELEREILSEEEQPDTNTIEACWTFLWNVTDETPENSELVARDGLELLMRSLASFPDSIPVHRNTMGLVTNIAEVRHLRSKLITSGLLQVMIGLIQHDDLEVSYNVCGTLCHILAEGVEYWESQGLSLETREECSSKISSVVLSWPLEKERGINYRSLKPLISLLQPELPSAVHIWAAWALLSLCSNASNLMGPMHQHYIKLFKKEGGEAAADLLVNNGNTVVKEIVERLAQTVKTNVT
eukprot:m.41834 g.41834  ORF g.41834 m.41834 type:complete len:372 (+) comp9817_c0_seq1:1684-2799(+)